MAQLFQSVLQIFFVRLRDGYSFKSVTPAEAVTHIEKPVLFIHSIPDTFIPASMSLDLYNKKVGPRKLKLFDTGLMRNPLMKIWLNMRN